jgi:hypothetical protein
LYCFIFESSLSICEERQHNYSLKHNLIDSD